MIANRTFAERVRRPWCFGLLQACVLLPLVAAMPGCGGKPAAPPPGAEKQTEPLDVEMGDSSASPPDASETSGQPVTGDESPAGDEPETDQERTNR
jgi:hypothetical protein